jgi:diguanylate cyclase (GGDEF)-like protein
MQENLSVIFVDLDEFKAVNDAHGHRAGDALLVGIGQQLQRVMRRAGDLVGRYGGDEFVVVLPSTSLEEAGAIAQRIQSSLGRMQVLFGKMTLRVGASVGVACSNPYQDTGGVEDLLDRADSAVYAAKKLGRNLIIASVPGPDGFEFAHVQTVAKREPAPQVSVEPQRSARR